MEYFGSITNPDPSKESMPTDINMVGGTMPGLMFYAGFMQGLFNSENGIKLSEVNSISGTSAGAFIAAMTAVGHHQELLKIIIDTFGDDTGWKNLGVFGEKTIQGNFGQILHKYISDEELQTEGTPRVKTLHMEMEKGPYFTKTEHWKYKEVVWLIQSIIKDQLFKLGSIREKREDKRKGIVGDIEHYGEHKVFDSSEVIEGVQNSMAGLIAASGQYSPVLDEKTRKLRIDGEFGSWHESSDTSLMLLDDDNIGDKSHILMLTRFSRGTKGNDAVLIQSAKIQEKTNPKSITIIAPAERLQGGIIDTNPENMKHNFISGQKAAELYLESLGKIKFT